MLAKIILSLFLGLMFVSLFQMSGQGDMSHGMTDCPFMSHEEVICPMNLTDHIGVWKSVFATFVPTAVTFLLVLAGAGFLGATKSYFLYKWKLLLILVHSRQLQQKTYTYVLRPLQELFSNGILNPKLYWVETIYYFLFKISLQNVQQ